MVLFKNHRNFKDLAKKSCFLMLSKLKQILRRKSAEKETYKDVDTSLGSGYDPIKVCLLCGAAAGKTCLVYQFVYNRFLTSSDDPTICEETSKKQMVIDGEEILLEILDTGGRRSEFSWFF